MVNLAFGGEAKVFGGERRCPSGVARPRSDRWFLIVHQALLDPGEVRVVVKGHLSRRAENLDMGTPTTLFFDGAEEGFDVTVRSSFLHERCSVMSK